MFIPVLYAIAKTWKPLKCPSTGVDQEDVVHTHNGILAIKRKEIRAFAATGMDLEIIMLSEASQTVRYQCHMLSLTCGI